MRQKLATFIFLSIVFVTMPLRAESILIGKSAGIVWEGLPFNVTLSGPVGLSTMWYKSALMAITSRADACVNDNDLITIGGVKAIQIAPGVGLVPRATGTATYTDYDGKIVTYSGTIGLPETRGGNAGELSSPAGLQWCLPPSMTNIDKFFKPGSTRTVTISGTWVLITDGSQRSNQTFLPPMYAASFAVQGSDIITKKILPDVIQLRVSTLECNVATPTSIDFGYAKKDLRANTELAIKSYPLTTACSQSSTYPDTNINVQFRAISGMYQGNARRLALDQGGGYITGEISNVTGSGACDADSGVRFDNTQMKVGTIGITELKKVITNNVTWRLCSGGQSLPSGPVSAAAEMLVTFN